MPPNKVSDDFQTVASEFRKLRPLSELLVSVGNQLRLEQRMAYEQLLPSICEVTDQEQFRQTVGGALNALRAFLQNVLVSASCVYSFSCTVIWVGWLVLQVLS